MNRSGLSLTFKRPCSYFCSSGVVKTGSAPELLYVAFYTVNASPGLPGMNRYSDCRGCQVQRKPLRNFGEMKRISWSAHQHRASVIKNRTKPLFAGKSATRNRQCTNVPCPFNCRPVAQIRPKRKCAKHKIALAHSRGTINITPRSHPGVPIIASIEALERHSGGAGGLVKIAISRDGVSQQPAVWRIRLLFANQ